MRKLKIQQPTFTKSGRGSSIKRRGSAETKKFQPLGWRTFGLDQTIGIKIHSIDVSENIAKLWQELENAPNCENSDLQQ